MNFGASAAIEDGANRLVFVNLDVKFDKDWLMELNNAMDKQQDCAMVQSKILLFNAENKRIINTIGNQIHYLGFGQTVGYKQPDCEIAELSEIKGYASGVSFMIKSEIFKRVGGYDEEYFMYHDDIELSYKTRLLKQKIYLAPKSIIYHKYEFSRSIKMLYYMERNRFLFIFQFYKLPTIVLLLPMIFCLEVGMHFYAVIGHWFRVKLNADFYFWRISTWRKIMLKRKFIKTFRKTNDKEMFRSFNSQIQFAEIENSVLKYLGNPLMKIFAKFAKMIIFW
jgi:GT2 family glycosyltransferase